MEIARRFLARSPSRFQAYLALQRALMSRHLARGGTIEDFCHRLAPAFRRRWSGLLHETRPDEP
jgi:hypothetical protein